MPIILLLICVTGLTIVGIYSRIRWLKCQDRLDLANVKLETLRRYCVVLSLECNKKDITIRKLHER